MLDEAFFEKLRQCYEAKEALQAFDSELPIVKQALTAIGGEISSLYEIVEPKGIGGAGIVVQVRHVKTSIEYALKLPRPCGQAYLDTVKGEMEHLIKIRHGNIISIHYMDEVEVANYSYPFFVMDYIHNAINLRERLEDIIGQSKSSRDISKITSWLAEKLLSIARALEFLHQLKIIHFDVKPGNIFIDTRLNDHPVLADLGYAKSQTESDKEVIVGFTYFYAHPDLTRLYTKASGPDRITRPKAPKDFKFIWDVFSLGKSTLELLALMDRAFPDTVGYDVTFSYLHLAACRMFDGLNLTHDETDRLRAERKENEPLPYFETWQRLSRRELQEGGMRYSDMSQIVNDLEKLNDSSAMTRIVPELNLYIPHTVHISEHGPAPFTYRVKKIIEHPTFSRLSEVPQLGLVRLIYPPATHTRLDHSIGVFRNACHYIQALYNDPYNPLFRQLVNTVDLKVILVASLLHDLGYFPFAHEFEGISPIFNHVQITVRLLDNPAIDNDGHTIEQIIEDNEWGWGIPIGSVKAVLEPEKHDQLLVQKNFKNRLLSSLIDSPIDADKTDYLLRDSDECRLPYGKLVDYDRLIRTLTVILAVDNMGICYPQLGVYEKGQSAAESLTFARYLLYQALYWHHSSRAIRVMLRQAVADALKTKKKTKSGKRDRSFTDEFDKLLGISSPAKRINSDDILNFISEWTSDSGREMIALLKARKFYKRILTIHDEKIPSDHVESTWEKLQRVHDRRNILQKDLHEKIITEFANIINAQSYSKVSLLAQENVDRTQEVLRKENAILIDIPNPSYGSEKSLNIMPEPERLQRNYATRIETAERISEVWSQVHHKLMRIAAKSRVYCHPDARDTLMAALKPEDIKNLLDGMLYTYLRGG